MTVRDKVPTEKLREFKMIAREFSQWLSQSPVPTTIDVYVVMRQQRQQIESDATVSP